MVYVIEGGPDADVLQGTRLPEVIYGGEGDDIINPRWPFGRYNSEKVGPDIAYGGSGNDRIFLTIGAYEAIYGGEGDDRLEIPQPPGYSIGDDYFYGGEGRDTVDLRADDSYRGLGILDITWRVSIEDGLIEQYSPLFHSRLFGLPAPWRKFLEFSGVENVIAPSTDDTLIGSDAANDLNGLGGDDVIDGQGGDDKLHGGLGNDRITDGAGRDRLFGGQGADTFVLRLDGEVDSIKDFENGLDRLDRLDLTAWDVDGLEDLSISAHHKPGKVIVRAGDEVLAVQGAGLRATELDDSDFLFGQV